jgi:Protein of unknown function (DUF3147)
MSSAAQEPSFLDRLDERPKIDSGKIAQTRPRELLYRFAAGALTSVISGAATLAFGPRVGGILLAFPAILAASLTLIEEQEDSLDAREDARGAIVGGCGLVAFAAVATLALGHMAGALALVLAAIAWAATAVIGYALLWWRSLHHAVQASRGCSIPIWRR